MAVQRFELDVDPSFEIHTSYHNDFFLLRTRVLVNGENTEIRSVRKGKYEGPVLNFCHSGSTISTKLHLIASTVSPILAQQFGVYHVDTFYYEQSPLFHVVFSSESCLKNFIRAIGEVKSALESQFQSLFSIDCKNMELSQHLNVEIQPELFLVSPNRQETKGAEVHLVTVENCSDFVTLWKESKLFDFGALYKEKAEPPKIAFQPTSQDHVRTEESVTFSVQATGTELVYQWQWKQFGKKGEKVGWQNLSWKGSTFQVVEVQGCNAGYYRCVVSNSAGSDTSQCASLTVVPDLLDLESELQDVNDWVTFGLYLGIKMPRLEAVKEDCQTLGKCRTQMLNEWQKKVTPTWSAVVQALVGIGMRRLGLELAEKYGVSPPKLLNEEPLEQLKNISQQEEATRSYLLKEVEKRKGGLEQDHRKLADTDERLRDSQRSKSVVNEKVCQVMHRIEELHKKVRKIVQEKKILTIELQSKQRECQLLQKECQLLSEMKEKDAVLNSMLDEKINGKQKEIESLEKQLQKRESDLQSAKQEAGRWQEELLKARTNLKEKDQEVIQLKNEYEKLSCSYSIEKEQVSKLIQLTVDLRSDKLAMEQRLIDIKEESDSKSQRIESCEQYISHLSEEVEGLSHCLHEKEATVAQLQSKLQSHEQLATTPETLSELLKLAPQIARLECRLQEAEYQKLQAELERQAAIEEVEAIQNFVTMLHVQLDEPPKITLHPKSLKEVCPTKPVVFTVKATGTDPLSYHWQWKPAGESEEWQPCDTDLSDGATMTIPSVQKCNEGSYHCVISNYAGSQTSNPAELSTADPPGITTQPQDLKDTVPGSAVMFTVEATGTDPLSYHWEWKPPEEKGEWQPCDTDLSDGATMTILSVQKSNEGSYHCVISNYAGTHTSDPAQLSVADPPKVIFHPQELKSVVPGQPAMFTVQAAGITPLIYQWEWKPAENEEWQLCDTQGSDSATLIIPSAQKSNNEGSYRCVISNCAGGQASKPAQLSVADPPKVIFHPQELKNVVPGQPAMFTVQAAGITPLIYQWEWKPAENEEWQLCDAQGSDSATLIIPSAQKSNEGSYRCIIRNYAGGQASNPANLSVAEPPSITTHPQQKVAVQGTSAKFTIQAIGTEPLSYLWQWKPWPAKKWWMWGASEEEWKSCDAKGSDSAILTIPNVQKTNEGDYRCVISNCAGHDTSHFAQLKTLQLPLQLRWRRYSDMEYGMIGYPHCVVLERSVYVGGGLTYDDDDEYYIQEFNIKTQNWSRLPRYEYRRFAMTVINHHLTLVGGCRVGGREVTNQLAVYEPSSQHWTYPYNPMPTPRYRPAVLMYDIWLLVAGGGDASYTDLATVELFNTSTNQWLAASSLPTPCSLLTSAIVDDYGYLVMNSKEVFRVSLPDIVSQTVDQSTSKLPALWCRLPDTPLSCSTAISLHGYLLAVGGSHDNGTRSTDIHLYQPESEQWTKVGDLPNAHQYCSCVVLPSGELLVAGGRESSAGWSSRVDVASVLN